MPAQGGGVQEIAPSNRTFALGNTGAPRLSNNQSGPSDSMQLHGAKSKRCSWRPWARRSEAASALCASCRLRPPSASTVRRSCDHPHRTAAGGDDVHLRSVLPQRCGDGRSVHAYGALSHSSRRTASAGIGEGERAQSVGQRRRPPKSSPLSLRAKLSRAQNPLRHAACVVRACVRCEKAFTTCTSPSPSPSPLPSRRISCALLVIPGGPVTSGMPSTYFYTKFFESVEAVAEYAFDKWAEIASAAGEADEFLLGAGKAPLNEDQKFQMRHSIRRARAGRAASASGWSALRGGMALAGERAER